MFKGEHAYEVNAIDLIALEAFRVFEPAVYARVIKSKQALTGYLPRGILDNTQIKELTASEVKSIVDAASEEYRKPVQKIICELFPQSSWVFDESGYGHNDEEWLRNLRVCHPSIFDRYFHMTISDGDVSQSDIQLVITLAGNREALTAHFKSLEERGLLSEMLSRLESYKQTIDIAHAVPFITTLMDIGDELHDEQSIFTYLGPRHHTARIIFWYLIQEPDKSKRAAILREVLMKTNGLYIAAHIIADESKDDRDEGNLESCLLERSVVKEFQEILIHKIERSAKEGSLVWNRCLQGLLWRWREWAGEKSPNTWVQKEINSDTAFLAILVAFTGRTSSIGMHDYVEKQSWNANLQILEQFVPLEIVEKRLREINRSGLSPEQERAVQAFDEAFQTLQKYKLDNHRTPGDSN